MQSKVTSGPERRRFWCAVAREHDARSIRQTRDFTVGARLIAIARRGIAISLQTIEP